ncbi:light-harvesting complex-like protein 3 isotype 1, chloroplastic [Juglans microcarpa x Juglans regia]|uniref:light-harvesting complex-like protein 3 isotype 1, chloroplastic n=1 Tax=Juglans microcarpa x Juglans regia TaxID=2249226 RepID=UPI001B7ED924|nr:light-harvesting complex-like protein 3 isotype 1, chloroplastic [Juglans microcarpa x Juglans regia]
MASITIIGPFNITCSSHHVTKKQQPQSARARSLGPKHATYVVTPDLEGQKGFNMAEQHLKSPLHIDKSKNAKDEVENGIELEHSAPRFTDERWKHRTWDLNMFVKDGKMDWGEVIVAEARRRKFLELYPEASTNEEPVLFRTSIIPWWAWLSRSHLPESELLNGRAAMVGFFIAYLVDALTGLDVVGQTENFICKAGLLVTVIGVMLFRRTQDFENLKRLADEATFYDKQWPASWQDNKSAATGASKQTGKNS